MKKLEKETSSLEDEDRLLRKTKEDLKKTYGEKKIVNGRRVKKLVKTVATCFVEVEMFIYKAIPKVFFEIDIRTVQF